MDRRTDSALWEGVSQLFVGGSTVTKSKNGKENPLKTRKTGPHLDIFELSSSVTATMFRTSTNVIKCCLFGGSAAWLSFLLSVSTFFLPHQQLHNQHAYESPASITGAVQLRRKKDPIVEEGMMMMMTSSSISPFEPGSLNMKPGESIAKCWTGSPKPQEQRTNSVQNCLYSQHFNVSSNLSGKTGTSTQKEVLGKTMGAVEVPCNSIPPQEHLLRVATIREPFDRFVSGYKEAMSRQDIYGTRETDEVEIPQQYTRFLQVLENKSIAEKKEIFDAQTPSLLQLKTQMFEAFVHDYDGENVFDRHLNAQIIKLWDPWGTGMGQFDVIMESATLTDDLTALADCVGAPQIVQEVRARSRTNDRIDIESLQDATIQKICRLLALDYCCLNYKLPEACSRALPGERVMCHWVTGDNNFGDQQIRSILV